MSTTRSTCAFVLFMLLGAATVRAAIPASERAALTALYDATNGAAWTDRTNWRNAGDTDFNAVGTECAWYGVTCDSAGTTVIALFLGNNNLTGSLPAQLDGLTGLQTLYLYSNHLSGGIPAQLGSLANLENLSLRGNQLDGTVPTELGKLSSLQNLDLASNQLTGGIPTSFGGLASLTTLDLTSNRLDGTIPAELGNASSLQRIFLAANQLHGSIPTALGKLSNLQWLKVSVNQLTGSIPASLGDLSNLVYLDLSNNQLTGGIPPGLGALPNLLRLVLMSNQLTGSIPPALGKLGSLVELFLGSNRLDGGIPPALGKLANLETLSLGDNQLTGTLPTELSNLSNLKKLIVEYNHLEGAIPAWIGNLSSLTNLWLDGNRFDGSIPSNLGDLLGLTYLRLGANRLTGRVPSSLADLSNLATSGGLTLDRNALWSDDATLDAFLDQYDSGWADTQTIAPTWPSVYAAGDTTLWVSWDPILYTGDQGGYEVLWRESSGGAWRSAGWTASKSDTTFPVTGLAPGTTYEVGVRSFTEPDVSNQNKVVSELSSTYIATTSSIGCAAPAITRSGGIPATLGLAGSYSGYLWSNGETTPSIEVSPAVPTWYWVVVSWPGSCEETAAVLVDPVKIFVDGFEGDSTGRWSRTVGQSP